MTQEISATEENDAAAFEAADNLQRKFARRERSKQKKEKRLQPTPLTTRQKFLYVLGAVLVLNMLSAYILGGNQTTAVQRLLSSDATRWNTSLAYLPYLLFLVLPIICIYQLFVYFSNWSLSAYEKWKRGSLLLLARIFAFLSFGVFIAATSAAYLSATAYFLNISVYALNFRLDNSSPMLVSSQLIDRIPSSSYKIPATLILKDWRTSDTNTKVKIGDSQDVFEIQGKTVTFYLREGAFDWPYAVEKSFALNYLRSQPVQKD
jgi:hypothetical protein